MFRSKTKNSRFDTDRRFFYSYIYRLPEVNIISTVFSLFPDKGYIQELRSPEFALKCPWRRTACPQIETSRDWEQQRKGIHLALFNYF